MIEGDTETEDMGTVLVDPATVTLDTGVGTIVMVIVGAAMVITVVEVATNQYIVVIRFTISHRAARVA